MLHRFLILAIILDSTLASPIYQRCNTVFTEYTLFDASNNSILSFSAQLRYVKSGSGPEALDMVVLSNISAVAQSPEIYELQEVDTFVDDVDNVCWLEGSCELFVENSTLVLFLNAQQEMDTQNFRVFAGLIDEKSFSLDDGFIFTQDATCHTATGYVPLLTTTAKFVSNHCCTEFSPAVPPKPVPQPKCKEFSSRSTLYNSDDNYSIFATLQANYTLKTDNLKINTNYSGGNGSIFELSINAFVACVGNSSVPITCNFPIQNFDTRMLCNVRMQMVDIMGSDSWEFDFDGGRLILFGNQTLGAEAQPFTSKNNCIYFSHQFSVPKIFQSQFCCTLFES